ncbi:phage holin [Bacillus cereus]|uniref:phage holin n=1 Tax=Bacillus cereus TaxID=1396 RepID=UPI0013D11E63|nr:phage holin [Bacillus cereus]
MKFKEILQDKALLTKYVVLIFAVVNSVLNLVGIQTIGDEQINDIASAVTTLASLYLAVNVRAHEIKNLRGSNLKENHKGDN